MIVGVAIVAINYIVVVDVTTPRGPPSLHLQAFIICIFCIHEGRARGKERTVSLFKSFLPEPSA